MSEMRGIFNILATPFDECGALDLPSLRNLVQFQIACGVDGLTILGVLGEAAKLSVAEREQVLAEVVTVAAGRVPIVVGASHPDDATCQQICRGAERAGAAGVMVAPPPRFAEQAESELAGYYAQLAASFSIPIVVQDFPPVNGVTMSPATIAQLAADVPAARYLKLEDPPLMRKIAAILALNPEVVIFGGLGGMFLLEELRRGAAGTMTGFAFSEVLIAVERAHHRGDDSAAARIFDRYLPLIRYENQPLINLTLRKFILHLRGVIAHPAPREPFAPLGDGVGEELSWILRRVGIEDPKEILQLDTMEG